MNAKTKFYMMFASVLLTIIAVSATGLWLYFYQVRGAYVSLREHQAQLMQAGELQDSLLKMRGTVSKREEDIKKIRTTLYRPGENDLETHLAYLKLVEDLAAELSLTPFTMSRSSSGAEAGAFGTRFSFSTSGTYANIIKFVAMLEQLPVFTLVEQATFSGSGEAMSLNITIAVATTQ